MELYYSVVKLYPAISCQVDVRLFCPRRHKAQNERCTNKACLCTWNVVCAILSASKPDRDFSHCYPTSKLFEEHWGMTKVVSILQSEGCLYRRHYCLSLACWATKAVFHSSGFWIGSPKNQPQSEGWVTVLVLLSTEQVKLKRAWEAFAASLASSCWHPWEFVDRLQTSLPEPLEKKRHHLYPK